MKRQNIKISRLRQCIGHRVLKQKKNKRKRDKAFIRGQRALKLIGQIVHTRTSCECALVRFNSIRFSSNGASVRLLSIKRLNAWGSQLDNLNSVNECDL